MKIKVIILFLTFFLVLPVSAQINDSINKTDKYGKKQGHWIKKYPNGAIQYNGYFKDNQPYGVFKRYFENDTLHSFQIFSNDGKTAESSIYHPNGFIASKGKFINQLKEGKWQFFSNRIKDYLICEEEYSKNIKNGLSVKYYPDMTPSEKKNYVNDVHSGEWTQYYSNGVIALKANYIDGKLQGKYEVFFETGKPEYLGQYKDDTRDGVWKIYNADGNLRKTIEYLLGAPKYPELYRKEMEYIDSLQTINKGKIADPEKTGTIWK